MSQEEKTRKEVITIYPPLETSSNIGASTDYLVEINSRKSAFKNRHYYKKILILLLILLFLIVVAFIITLCDYIKSKNELTEIKKSHHVCTTTECLRAAANLKLSMDQSVDPCDDFYQFSCGKWTDEHPNHGWFPHFSSFETINERVAIAALNFFNSNGTSDEPLPVNQSRILYHSCLDLESAATLGFSVLFKYLKIMELPIVPSIFGAPDADFKFDWVKADVALKKILAMDVFIGVIVDADIFNRSNSVIYMGTPGNECPLPSAVHTRKLLKKYVKTLSEEEESDIEEQRGKAYKKVIKEVIKVIAINASTTALNEEILVKAVDSIWNITRDLEELTDTNDTINDLQFYVMKIDDIQNVTNQYLMQNNEKPTFLWKRYLTILFEQVPNISVDFDNKDLIYVAIEEFGYFSEIALYISQIPDPIMELYMWWNAVFSMILSTSPDIADFVEKESFSFNKLDVHRSRSLDCASIVINFMGIAVSYGIVDNTFINETKPKVEQMLNNIKDSFVERVQELNWMDKTTKSVTLEKSMEMISLIGFPDWLLNKSAVEEYYSNLTMDSKTFLENLMGMVVTYTPSRLASLGRESARTWRTDPTTVNAYNYFSDNSITVPMAILTYPLYNLGLEVLNYGAIGSILGHELTHGFDNTGRRFDKYGNYKQWWSNKTIEAFENKTKCFINQYENYTLDMVKENVNGEFTLGENLADNGGLHHAFLAYKKHINYNEREKKLPGFEVYSDEQLFFLAFGSIWCETQTAAALTYQLKYDEHCPSAIRVFGTLQNSYEFAKAFKCPIGSKMNPKRERCRIW